MMKTLKTWLARHLPEPKVTSPEEDGQLQRAKIVTRQVQQGSREYVREAGRISSGIATGLSRNHIAPAFDSAYEIRGHRST